MSKYSQSLPERTSEIYLSKLFLKKNTGEGRIVENTGNWLTFLLLGLWDRGRGGGVNSSLYLGFNDFKCFSTIGWLRNTLTHSNYPKMQTEISKRKKDDGMRYKNSSAFEHS